jgi:hypothetical protein
VVVRPGLLDLDVDELLDLVADAADADEPRAARLLDRLLEADGEPGVILRLACSPYV